MVGALLWQFIIAGQLVLGTDVTVLHAIGAGALHLTIGVNAVAAYLRWRRTRADEPLFVGGAVVLR